MSLDIGALVARISVDDREFDRGLNRGERRFGGFSKKILAAASFVGIGIGTSVAKSLDLEPAVDKLAAELGLSASDSAAIGKVAGTLYAQNYGDSLSDVNGAIAAVVTSIDGMSVKNGKALQAATVDALNFAKTFDSDVPRAVQVAGQIIKSGLAKDSSDAFDLITAASQRVPKALRDDILDAVDEYGPAFAQIGFSGQQAFAMLVKSSEKGMYGIDKAGDAIKEFTIRSTDMSTGTKAAFDAIGLDAGKMANAILAGGDAAQNGTQKVIAGLLALDDPAKQANAAIALFGTPLEDLNTSEIPAFLKSMQAGSDAMDGYAGAADRMGKTLNDNASTSLGELKRRAEMAFLGLGNGLLPAINAVTAAAAAGLVPAIGGTISVLRNMAEFVEDNQTTIKVLAGIILTLLLPAIIAWGVQTTVSAGKAAAAWVLSQVGAAQSAALHVLSLTLMTAAWVKAAAQATWSAVKVAAAWLIAMGPIGLVIAAIGGLVFIIIKNWDTIKSVFASGVNWVKGNWKKLGMILLAITGPIGLVVLAFIKNFDKIKAAASAVVGFIKGIPGKIGALASRFGSVGRSLINAFVNGMKNAGGVISGIAGNVWNAVKKLLNQAISQINAALEFTIEIPGPNIHINPPNIPQLANGGYIHPKRGGTLAILAEAGEGEYAVPESKADEFARARLAGKGYEGLGYPTTDRGPLIGNVYQQPDESADELAERLWRLTRARG